MSDTSAPRPRPWSAILLFALILSGLLGVGTSAAASAAPVRPAAGVRTAPDALASGARLSTGDLYSVSVAASQQQFPSGGAPVVYLASGEKYQFALAAAPIAARYGGALLLTPAAGLAAAVETELGRLRPPKVVIVGGTSIVSAAVAARVAVVLPAASVSRIDTADAYAAAASLSASRFATGGAATVFVASGTDFSEALPAAASAAHFRGPVLLTAPGGLPAATATEIKRLAPTRVVLVGGTTAIPAAVAMQIAALGPSVARVSGSDRYAMAAAMAASYFPTASTVIAASGTEYGPAVAASVLAAVRDAPILLANRDNVPVPTRDALRARPPATLLIAGGYASIGEITRGELLGWAQGKLTIWTGSTYPSYDSLYHDYGEMVNMLTSAEIAAPDRVHIFSIGKSYQGRDILAAKVSKNVAVDENEPEVLVDSLHHAREHLGLEQSLYLLRMLTDEYSTDPTVRRLEDSREIYIIFAVNPDGFIYDLTGNPYQNWRKNRQPNAGSSYVGTDINRNYEYGWGCCGGSSGSPSAWNYRGSAPFSTPEAQAVRNFVLSRVVNGKQQIKVHVTLHTNGEQILYPYSYTTTAIPTDMSIDDHSTFVAMANAMAARNGYTPMQSSHLYVTDGDEIDWMYHRQHIFSFTWELYPTEQYTDPLDFEPPDEVIAAQTARNRTALLYLIDMAGCPYDAIGKGAVYCSPQHTGAYAASTYVPLTPTRLVDSRSKLGLGGALAANSPQVFQVTGRNPTDPARNVPATAVAVTGNLTVAGQTVGGYVSLTPTGGDGISLPATSTINFPVGDIRANAVTVPLGSGGRLAVTYATSSRTGSTEVVFDVTGYYVAGTAGARYVPVTPNRIVDSRSSARLQLSSPLVAGAPQPFHVTDRVPSDPTRNIPPTATAVTGNLTVTGQTAAGYFSLTPTAPAAGSPPATSTLNFPKGDTRANGVTVRLGTGGTLVVEFMSNTAGATAHVVFDVTGYYAPGSTGAMYVPVTPNRLLDSRPSAHVGLGSSLTTGVARSFQVTGRVPADPARNVPLGSVAVTGNLTAVGQTASGYLTLAPTATSGTIPATSTLNFPKGDIRANGVTVPILVSYGTLSILYTGTVGGATADAVFDVSGYFVNSPR